MTLMNVLAMSSPGGSGGGSAMAGFIPIILMFGVFWFLIIRPQKKQADQRKAMIAAIKRGDKVVTNGGLFGTVRDVKGDRVVMTIAENIKVEVAKGSVSIVEEATE
jgi:preprotein translocase subunit YajC